MTENTETENTELDQIWETILALSKKVGELSKIVNSLREDYLKDQDEKQRKLLKLEGEIEEIKKFLGMDEYLTIEDMLRDNYLPRREYYAGVEVAGITSSHIQSDLENVKQALREIVQAIDILAARQGLMLIDLLTM